MKNSHDIATTLQEIADFLRSKEAFPVEGIFCMNALEDSLKSSLHFYSKERFVEAVKSIREYHEACC